MSTPVNSATTNYFDYSVNYDYYLKQVIIQDASSYKAGGAALVQGIDFLITSPQGIIVSNNTLYGVNADIIPATPNPFVKDLPTFNGAIEYGSYTIVGTLKDQDGKLYSLTKVTNLCPPTQCDDDVFSNGCVTFSFAVQCNTNKIIISDQTNFALKVNGVVYNPASAADIVYSLTVVDPNLVLKANGANVASFQISPIVNGNYQVTVNDTATYTVGDLVTVTVHYLFTNKTFRAACDIDLCEVYCCFDSLYKQWLAIKGTGSPQEKVLKDTLDRLSWLINQAQIGLACGKNIDATLLEIEALANCKCACGCGTQNTSQGGVADKNIIVAAAGGDIVVNQTNVADTTYFYVNDIHYVVSIANDGVSPSYLTVTPTTTGYTTTYEIAFTPSPILNPVLTNVTTAVQNATNALETLNTYALAANKLNTNESEIIIETWFKNLDATKSILGTFIVDFNATNLFNLTIVAPVLYPARYIKVTCRIVRVSNTTLWGMSEVVYYANGGGFVGQEVNTLPNAALVAGLDLVANSYNIRTRTTQSAAANVENTYLKIIEFRK